MTNVVSGWKILNGDELPIPSQIDWVVEEFLARGVGTILFGQPGVGKSGHVAALLAQLEIGGSYGTLRINGKGHRILYLDADASWNFTGYSIRAAYKGIGLEKLPSNFHYISLRDATPLPLAELGMRVANAVAELGIDVVIVDTFGAILEGDVNSTEDVHKILQLVLNPMLAEGAAVLVLDHEAKSFQGGSGTPIGSQAKRGWARVSVRITKNNSVTKWKIDKANGKGFSPFTTQLEYKENANGQLETVKLLQPPNITSTIPLKFLQQIENQRKSSKVRENILSTLAKGDARRGDFPHDGAYENELVKLMEEGEIAKVQRGRYALA